MPEKVMSEIPKLLTDLQYDWFARLIPGSIGVMLWFVLNQKEEFLANPKHLALILLSGYIFGNVLQPLSGMFVKNLEKGLDRKCKKKPDGKFWFMCAEVKFSIKNSGETSIESIYSQNKDPECSKSQKANKAHAEANSACTTLLTSSIVFVGTIIHNPNIWKSRLFGINDTLEEYKCIVISFEILFVIILLLFSIRNRIIARGRKILDMLDSKPEKNDATDSSQTQNQSDSSNGKNADEEGETDTENSN